MWMARCFSLPFVGGKLLFQTGNLTLFPSCSSTYHPTGIAGPKGHETDGFGDAAEP